MIWNKSEIKPETNYSIIFLTENNKFCTLSEGNKNLTTDWKWLVDKYSIKYWALQKDLISEINFLINNHIDNDLNFTGNILMSSTTETSKFIDNDLWREFDDVEFRNSERDNLDALDD